MNIYDVFKDAYKLNYYTDKNQYFTNGHFAVSIKHNGKKPEMTIKETEVTRLISSYLNEFDYENSKFKKIQIDYSSQSKEKCDVCKGKKVTNKIKKECSCNNGEVVFYDDYNNEYEFECLECNGKTFRTIISGDENITCYKCNGTGLKHNPQCINLGKKVYINYNLYTNLKKCFGELYFDIDNIKGYKMPFKFENGNGLLMIMTSLPIKETVLKGKLLD